MATVMRSRARRSRLACYGIGIVLLVPLLAVAEGSAASAAPICWAGPAVVRGNLWLLGSGYGTQTASRSFGYGRAGDRPFFGHWDARSALSAPGVVRGRTWLLRRSQSSGVANITFTYGREGDIPIVGDWNGDGIDTPGVVRGTTWYLRNHNSGGVADITFTFNAPGSPTTYGNLGGPPLVATFDAGTWHVRRQYTTGGADFTQQWGQAGDIPLEAGFYLQDCTSTYLAVVRGNVWHIGFPGGNRVAFGYGRAGDIFLTQHY
jgi:hypothetical protein